MYWMNEILPLATLVFILWLVVGSLFISSCVNLIKKYKEEPKCSIVELIVEDHNVSVIFVSTGI